METVNKFSKIAALIQVINSSAKVSELVETANLTVAENITLPVFDGDATSAASTSQPTHVPALFQQAQLTLVEVEQLDRKLVNVVQTLMKEKIEDAVQELEALGVAIDGALYAKYIQSPDDL